MLIPMLPPLQVSYMILQRVSPVSHSIGNCLKRVIVIVASVLVFKNPMSQQNLIGAQSHSNYIPALAVSGRAEVLHGNK